MRNKNRPPCKNECKCLVKWLCCFSKDRLLKCHTNGFVIRGLIESRDAARLLQKADVSGRIFEPKCENSLIFLNNTGEDDKKKKERKKKQPMKFLTCPLWILQHTTEDKGESWCFHVLRVVLAIVDLCWEKGSAVYSPKPTDWQMGVWDSSTGPPLPATFSLRQHRATKLALAAYRMWLGATSQCVTPRATAEWGTWKERVRKKTQSQYTHNHFQRIRLHIFI